MGKCSSKEKKGRKLVAAKGNKGTSSPPSSPRASGATARQLSTQAQITPSKSLEVTQAVPTPTVSPAKLQQAKRSRTQHGPIGFEAEDSSEATTSQSLEEPELFFGEDIQIATSTSVPSGLRQRRLAINKESNQQDFPPDVRAEKFHDAIDDLPDFPVLDSSFDENEFRTPIGRLSTDSSYYSDKVPSFPERESGVTSHYGFNPKAKEIPADPKQAVPPSQKIDILKSKKVGKPRDHEPAEDKSVKGTFQKTPLCDTESGPFHQKTDGQLGVLPPIHTREEHFAAPSMPHSHVLAQAELDPTEVATKYSLEPNSQRQREQKPRETLREMDVVSPTESFEQIEASDAYSSEDDMQPRKSDSSYIMLENERPERPAEDHSLFNPDLVIIEKNESSLYNQETPHLSGEDLSKRSQAAHEPIAGIVSHVSDVEGKKDLSEGTHGFKEDQSQSPHQEQSALEPQETEPTKQENPITSKPITELGIPKETLRGIGTDVEEPAIKSAGVDEEESEKQEASREKTPASEKESEKMTDEILISGTPEQMGERKKELDKTSTAPLDTATEEERSSEVEDLKKLDIKPEAAVLFSDGKEQSQKAGISEEVVTSVETEAEEIATESSTTSPPVQGTFTEGQCSPEPQIEPDAEERAVNSSSAAPVLHTQSQHVSQPEELEKHVVKSRDIEAYSDSKERCEMPQFSKELFSASETPMEEIDTRYSTMEAAVNVHAPYAQDKEVDKDILKTPIEGQLAANEKQHSPKQYHIEKGSFKGMAQPDESIEQPVVARVKETPTEKLTGGEALASIEDGSAKEKLAEKKVLELPSQASTTKEKCKLGPEDLEGRSTKLDDARPLVDNSRKSDFFNTPMEVIPGSKTVVEERAPESSKTESPKNIDYPCAHEVHEASIEPQHTISEVQPDSRSGETEAQRIEQENAKPCIEHAESCEIPGSSEEVSLIQEREIESVAMKSPSEGMPAQIEVPTEPKELPEEALETQTEPQVNATKGWPTPEPEDMVTPRIEPGQEEVLREKSESSKEEVAGQEAKVNEQTGQSLNEKTPRHTEEDSAQEDLYERTKEPWHTGTAEIWPETKDLEKPGTAPEEPNLPTEIEDPSVMSREVAAVLNINKDEPLTAREELQDMSTEGYSQESEDLVKSIDKTNGVEPHLSGKESCESSPPSENLFPEPEKMVVGGANKSIKEASMHVHKPCPQEEAATNQEQESPKSEGMEMSRLQDKVVPAGSLEKYKMPEDPKEGVIAQESEVKETPIESLTDGALAKIDKPCAEEEIKEDLIEIPHGPQVTGTKRECQQQSENLEKPGTRPDEPGPPIDSKDKGDMIHIAKETIPALETEAALKNIQDACAGEVQETQTEPHDSSTDLLPRPQFDDTEMSKLEGDKKAFIDSVEKCEIPLTSEQVSLSQERKLEGKASESWTAGTPSHIHKPSTLEEQAEEKPETQRDAQLTFTEGQLDSTPADMRSKGGEESSSIGEELCEMPKASKGIFPSQEAEATETLHDSLTKEAIQNFEEPHAQEEVVEEMMADTPIDEAQYTQKPDTKEKPRDGNEIVAEDNEMPEALEKVVFAQEADVKETASELLSGRDPARAEKPCPNKDLYENEAPEKQTEPQDTASEGKNSPMPEDLEQPNTKPEGQEPSIDSKAMHVLSMEGIPAPAKEVEERTSAESIIGALTQSEDPYVQERLAETQTEPKAAPTEVLPSLKSQNIEMPRIQHRETEPAIDIEHGEIVGDSKEAVPAPETKLEETNTASSTPGIKGGVTQSSEQDRLAAEDTLKAAEPQVAASEGEPSIKVDDKEKPTFKPGIEEPSMDNEQNCQMPGAPKEVDLSQGVGVKERLVESLLVGEPEHFESPRTNEPLNETIQPDYTAEDKFSQKCEDWEAPSTKPEEQEPLMGSENKDHAIGTSMEMTPEQTETEEIAPQLPIKGEPVPIDDPSVKEGVLQGTIEPQYTATAVRLTPEFEDLELPVMMSKQPQSPPGSNDKCETVVSSEVSPAPETELEEKLTQLSAANAPVHINKPYAQEKEAEKVMLETQMEPHAAATDGQCGLEPEDIGKHTNADALPSDESELPEASTNVISAQEAEIKDTPIESLTGGVSTHNEEPCPQEQLAQTKEPVTCVDGDVKPDKKEHGNEPGALKEALPALVSEAEDTPTNSSSVGPPLPSVHGELTDMTVLDTARKTPGIDSEQKPSEKLEDVKEPSMDINKAEFCVSNEEFQMSEPSKEVFPAQEPELKERTVDLPTEGEPKHKSNVQVHDTPIETHHTAFDESFSPKTKDLKTHQLKMQPKESTEPSMEEQCLLPSTSEIETPAEETCTESSTAGFQEKAIFNEIQQDPEPENLDFEQFLQDKDKYEMNGTSKEASPAAESLTEENANAPFTREATVPINEHCAPVPQETMLTTPMEPHEPATGEYSSEPPDIVKSSIDAVPPGDTVEQHDTSEASEQVSQIKETDATETGAQEATVHINEHLQQEELPQKIMLTTSMEPEVPAIEGGHDSEPQNVVKSNVDAVPPEDTVEKREVSETSKQDLGVESFNVEAPVDIIEHCTPKGLLEKMMPRPSMEPEVPAPKEEYSSEPQDIAKSAIDALPSEDTVEWCKLPEYSKQVSPAKQAEVKEAGAESLTGEALAHIDEQYAQEEASENEFPEKPSASPQDCAIKGDSSPKLEDLEKSSTKSKQVEPLIDSGDGGYINREPPLHGKDKYEMTGTSKEASPAVEPLIEEKDNESSTKEATGHTNEHCAPEELPQEMMLTSPMKPLIPENEEDHISEPQIIVQPGVDALSPGDTTEQCDMSEASEQVLPAQEAKSKETGAELSTMEGTVLTNESCESEELPQEMMVTTPMEPQVPATKGIQNSEPQDVVKFNIDAAPSEDIEDQPEMSEVSKHVLPAQEAGIKEKGPEWSTVEDTENINKHCEPEGLPREMILKTPMESQVPATEEEHFSEPQNIARSSIDAVPSNNTAEQCELSTYSKQVLPGQEAEVQKTDAKLLTEEKPAHIHDQFAQEENSENELPAISSQPQDDAIEEDSSPKLEDMEKSSTKLNRLERLTDSTDGGCIDEMTPETKVEEMVQEAQEMPIDSQDAATELQPRAAQEIKVKDTPTESLTGEVSMHNEEPCPREELAQNKVPVTGIDCSLKPDTKAHSDDPSALKDLLPGSETDTEDTQIESSSVGPPVPIFNEEQAEKNVRDTSKRQKQDIEEKSREIIDDVEKPSMVIQEAKLPMGSEDFQMSEASKEVVSAQEPELEERTVDSPTEGEQEHKVDKQAHEMPIKTHYTAFDGSLSPKTKDLETHQFEMQPEEPTVPSMEEQWQLPKTLEIETTAEKIPAESSTAEFYVKDTYNEVQQGSKPADLDSEQPLLDKGKYEMTGTSKEASSAAESLTEENANESSTVKATVHINEHCAPEELPQETMLTTSMKPEVTATDRDNGSEPQDIVDSSTDTVPPEDTVEQHDMFEALPQVLLAQETEAEETGAEWSTVEDTLHINEHCAPENLPRDMMITAPMEPGLPATEGGSNLEPQDVVKSDIDAVPLEDTAEKCKMSEDSKHISPAHEAEFIEGGAESATMGATVNINEHCAPKGLPQEMMLRTQMKPQVPATEDHSSEPQDIAKFSIDRVPTKDNVKQCELSEYPKQMLQDQEAEIKEPGAESLTGEAPAHIDEHFAQEASEKELSETPSESPQDSTIEEESSPKLESLEKLSTSEQLKPFIDSSHEGCTNEIVLTPETKKEEIVHSASATEATSHTEDSYVQEAQESLINPQDAAIEVQSPPQEVEVKDTPNESLTTGVSTDKQEAYPEEDLAENKEPVKGIDHSLKPDTQAHTNESSALKDSLPGAETEAEDTLTESSTVLPTVHEELAEKNVLDTSGKTQKIDTEERSCEIFHDVEKPSMDIQEAKFPMSSEEFQMSEASTEVVSAQEPELEDRIVESPTEGQQEHKLNKQAHEMPIETQDTAFNRSLSPKTKDLEDHELEIQSEESILPSMEDQRPLSSTSEIETAAAEGMPTKSSTAGFHVKENYNEVQQGPEPEDVDREHPLHDKDKHEMTGTSKEASPAAESLTEENTNQSSTMEVTLHINEHCANEELPQETMPTTPMEPPVPATEGDHGSDPQDIVKSSTDTVPPRDAVEQRDMFEVSEQVIPAQETEPEETIPEFSTVEATEHIKEPCAPEELPQEMMLTAVMEPGIPASEEGCNLEPQDDVKSNIDAVLSEDTAAQSEMYDDPKHELPTQEADINERCAESSTPKATVNINEHQAPEELPQEMMLETLMKPQVPATGGEHGSEPQDIPKFSIDEVPTKDTIEQCEVSEYPKQMLSDQEAEMKEIATRSLTGEGPAHIDEQLAWEEASEKELPETPIETPQDCKIKEDSSGKLEGSTSKHVEPFLNSSYEGYINDMVPAPEAKVEEMTPGISGTEATSHTEDSYEQEAQELPMTPQDAAIEVQPRAAQEVEVKNTCNELLTGGGSTENKEPCPQEELAQNKEPVTGADRSLKPDTREHGDEQDALIDLMPDAETEAENTPTHCSSVGRPVPIVDEELAEKNMLDTLKETQETDTEEKFSEIFDTVEKPSMDIQNAKSPMGSEEFQMSEASKEVVSAQEPELEDRTVGSPTEGEQEHKPYEQGHEMPIGTHYIAVDGKFSRDKAPSKDTVEQCEVSEYPKKMLSDQEVAIKETAAVALTGEAPAHIDEQFAQEEASEKEFPDTPGETPQDCRIKQDSSPKLEGLEKSITTSRQLEPFLNSSYEGYINDMVSTPEARLEEMTPGMSAREATSHTDDSHVQKAQESPMTPQDAAIKVPPRAAHEVEIKDTPNESLTEEVSTKDKEPCSQEELAQDKVPVTGVAHSLKPDTRENGDEPGASRDLLPGAVTEAEDTSTQSSSVGPPVFIVCEELAEKNVLDTSKETQETDTEEKSGEILDNAGKPSINMQEEEFPMSSEKLQMSEASKEVTSAKEPELEERNINSLTEGEQEHTLNKPAHKMPIETHYTAFDGSLSPKTEDLEKHQLEMQPQEPKVPSMEELCQLPSTTEIGTGAEEIPTELYTAGFHIEDIYNEVQQGPKPENLDREPFLHGKDKYEMINTSKEASSAADSSTEERGSEPSTVEATEHINEHCALEELPQETVLTTPIKPQISATEGDHSSEPQDVVMSSIDALHPEDAVEKVAMCESLQQVLPAHEAESKGAGAEYSSEEATVHINEGCAPEEVPQKVMLKTPMEPEVPATEGEQNSEPQNILKSDVDAMTPESIREQCEKAEASKSVLPAEEADIKGRGAESMTVKATVNINGHCPPDRLPQEMKLGALMEPQVPAAKGAQSSEPQEIAKV